jgi:hypothetical protein
MTMAGQKSTPVSPRLPREAKSLNAQQVTSIAIGFLRSLGHGRGIKPRRVFIENQRYVVEAEIGKKMLAKVQIDTATREIKEYDIEKREESSSPISLEPKVIIAMFGIAALVSIIMAIVDLQAIAGGLL